VEEAVAPALDAEPAQPPAAEGPGPETAPEADDGAA